jgi:hypothetical protein
VRLAARLSESLREGRRKRVDHEFSDRLEGWDFNAHSGSIGSLVPSLAPTPNLVLRKFFGICKVLILQCAPVAQLDRAFDYESKGRKFESCRAHFLNK